MDADPSTVGRAFARDLRKLTDVKEAYFHTWDSVDQPGVGATSQTIRTLSERNRTILTCLRSRGPQRFAWGVELARGAKTRISTSDGIGADDFILELQ